MTFKGICEQEDNDTKEDKQPNTRIDAFEAYFSEGAERDDKRQITYSETLGVATEQLKPCFTIEDLWSIHND